MRIKAVKKCSCLLFALAVCFAVTGTGVSAYAAGEDTAGADDAVAMGDVELQTYESYDISGSNLTSMNSDKGYLAEDLNLTQSEYYDIIDKFLTTDKYAVDYKYAMTGDAFVWNGGTRWDCSSMTLYLVNFYLIPYEEAYAEAKAADPSATEETLHATALAATGKKAANPTSESGGQVTYSQCLHWGDTVISSSNLKSLNDSGKLTPENMVGKLEPGDLLYYGVFTSSGVNVSHVAVYLGQYKLADGDTGYYQMENLGSASSSAGTIIAGKETGVRVSAFKTVENSYKLIHVARIAPAPSSIPDGTIEKAEDGNWYYYVDGEVDTGVTTIAKNKNGWWYVKDGMVDFSYNGFWYNKNGWWYCENGKVRFDQNSVIKGAVEGTTGWWYVVGSKVQLDFTGLANYKNENGWWYIENGMVNFKKNTVAKNKNGWWYVTGGKVRFEFTGLANYKNENGWWYIKDGKVDFTYTGFGQNKNGYWYLENGKVSFKENGVIKDTTGVMGEKGGWWYVVGSKVQTTYGNASYTGVANYRNVYGWWYIKDGKVDFTYTGKAKNKNGTWNVVNGKVVF